MESDEPILGFPDSSVGKESTCNAGDPGSIPGLGRSAGDRRGYPLWYPWASLVAQLVKNLPAMWETWVQSLGQEDPPEKGMPTRSSIEDMFSLSPVHGIFQARVLKWVAVSFSRGSS